MEGDYCYEKVSVCKNSSLSEFSLGPAPCYIGIVSDSLSCVASILIISLYIAWKDLRDNGAQSIITFIAISDFFTAFGYMIGSINLLAYSYNDHLVKPDWGRCSIFKNVCEIENYVVTWATMSSYCWTIILSFYFYFSIAHNHNMTKKLMPLYHILAWGAPILILFPLLCFKKLVYAPFVSGNWCYIEIYHNKPPFTKDDNIIATFLQLPELISFVLIVVVFIFTCWKFHKQTLHRSTVIGHCNPERSVAVEGKMKVAKRLLVFIPVMFILLRVWCILQYFYTYYLANIAQNDGQCIPAGLKDGQLVLAILQAIGAGGQGWANCILYVFMSSSLRNRLFFCRCCNVKNILVSCGCCKANTESSPTSNFQPSYESFSTDTLVKNLENNWIK